MLVRLETAVHFSRFFKQHDQRLHSPLAQFKKVLTAVARTTHLRKVDRCDA